MDQMELTTAERETLPSWRFHHPHPRVQLQMEALSLKSQGLGPEAICRLCAIAKTTFSRDLYEDRAGGLDTLKEVSLHQRQSQLAAYRTSREADVRQRPPATVAEAAARIAALTGLERGPTQVRQFCKSLGMKPRNVGPLPAKADVRAPETVKTEQRAPAWQKPNRGSGLSAFWRRHLLALPRFWAWGGVVSDSVSQRPVGGSASMCWRR